MRTMQILKTLMDTVQQHRSAARTRRELMKLSDRELNDIGVTRFDIQAISARSFARPAQAKAATLTGAPALG